MFKELMQQVATYKGTVKKEYATHAAAYGASQRPVLRSQTAEMRS